MYITLKDSYKQLIIPHWNLSHVLVGDACYVGENGDEVCDDVMSLCVLVMMIWIDVALEKGIYDIGEVRVILTDAFYQVIYVYSLGKMIWTDVFYQVIYVYSLGKMIWTDAFYQEICVLTLGRVILIDAFYQVIYVLTLGRVI